VKKVAILMSIVMLVVFTVGMSFAAEKKTPKLVTLSGEVVKVDTKMGKIVIKADGKDYNLNAEPKILEGITVGDKVTVEKIKNMVKSIKKS
jgi:hypothetical protein